MSSEEAYYPPVTRREYKTIATRKQAEKRLGRRVESIGGGFSNGKAHYYLWVYDLDEYGQPPVFTCPACGRELDEDYA